MSRISRVQCGIGLLIASGSLAYAQTPPSSTGPAQAGGAQGASSSTNGAQLQEIVVTATKTGETDLQKTPLAMSAVSGAALERGVINDVRDLSRVTPGLVVSQSSDNAKIYIRGIGSSNVYNGSDPSTAVQVDGVYISRPYAQFTDFLDVSRVEVLRGPQGTLYGRNAVAGTINIISRQPSDRFAADEQLVVGNYGTVQNQAYLSGPIVKDLLQGSISVNYIRHDPYQTNIYPNSTGVNSANRGGVRVQLRAEPSSKLDATTRLDYSYDASRPNGIFTLISPINSLTNSILGNYHKVALNTPDRGRIVSQGVSEEVNYQVNDNLAVKSISAYRHNTNFVYTDADASDENKQSLYLKEKEEQISQEFNVTGHFGALTGVGGIYYFHEKISTVLQSSIFTSALAGSNRLYMPSSSADSAAVFSQLTYKLPTNVEFVGGIRYTTEQKVYDQLAGTTSIPGNSVIGTLGAYHLIGRYHALTPKLGINWTPTSNILLYASATEGFKSGGFNATATTASAAPFDPEKLWSYEIGEKGEFFDKTLRLNLSAFKYDYSNLQVQQTISAGVVKITNAANADLYGVEADAAWLPARWIEIGANVALLHAEYSQYPNAAFTGGGTGDASGKILNSAPKFSTNDYVEIYYYMPGDSQVSFRVNYNYKSRIYYDPSNRALLSQEGFSLVDMDVQWRSASRAWTLAFFVKNVANEQYLTSLTSQSGGIIQGIAGDPRTFGIRLGRHW
ncbi:MAG TPA: TonB-dependent receptor [Caulobacteraceae bacterium]|nr:TonB-dependent receptor [Caulobacteraceae bacterium]